MVPKSPFKSVTILGAILIAASTIAQALGVEFSMQDAQTITDKVLAVMDAGAELIGLVMVVWGRIRAKGPLQIGGAK